MFPLRHPNYHGRVVHIVKILPSGRREGEKHVEFCRTKRKILITPRHVNRHPLLQRFRQKSGVGIILILSTAEQNAAHLKAIQNRHQPVHMVGMRMREDKQIDGLPPQRQNRPQLLQHLRVRPAVHQNMMLLRRRQQNSVPLPDVQHVHLQHRVNLQQIPG